MWKRGGEKKREKQGGKKEGGKEVCIDFILYYNNILGASSMFAFFLHIIDLRNNHSYLHFINEETEGYTL